MNEQFFYGHGKLLLTGEYFVLDGARSIALPTTLGQKMHVTYRPSNNPILHWKSYNTKSECWLECKFELWHFDCLKKSDKEKEEIIVLQEILRQARKQNIHFLRDHCDVLVETSLEFDREWGLGSSSSLIYNIAQWAYISPYELLSKTFGGSGYDIACAQSMGPITYQLKSRGPHWETTNLALPFKDKLYFIHLNKKQNTREGIQRYNDLKNEDNAEIISKITEISDKILECKDYSEFNDLIFEHENLVSLVLDMPRIFDKEFSDYWGAVKSLGAWGGDFALVSSDKSFEETQEYFSTRGYSKILKYDELILQNFEKYGEVRIETLEDMNHGSNLS